MIFVDIDEVLSPFVKPFSEFLKNYYNININPDHVNCFHWYNNKNLVGLTKELWLEALEKWNYNQTLFVGADIFTHELAKLDRVIYLTARPNTNLVVERTMKMLNTCHDASIYFMPHSSDKIKFINNYNKNTGQFVIVEDHPETVIDCVKAGYRVHMPIRNHNINLNDDRINRYECYNQVILKEKEMRAK